MKISREIKTAILVIASILLFIWGYSFLKGRDLFSSYNIFYAEFDNVEGLSNSSPITLNGLAIGKVKSITIDTNTGKLKVALQILTDFPISATSVASIYEPGVISGKQIEIVPDFSNKTLAVDGQSLKSDVKLGLTGAIQKTLEPLQQKLVKVMDNIDQLLINVNAVLDLKSQENLRNSIMELSKTMQQIHQLTSNANQLVLDNKSDLKTVVSNFKKVSADFAVLSDSLKKSDLGGTVKNLNKTLVKVDAIMADLQSGKGTAGKLIKDEALYSNLKQTTKEMELLLQDLRLNPTRYINVSLFGKKNKPYLAPANDSVYVGSEKTTIPKVKN